MVASALAARGVRSHGGAAGLLPPAPRIRILFSFAVVNLFLGLFNLLPIPPLDGSALIERVLPEPWLPPLVPVPAVRLPRAVPAGVLHRVSPQFVAPFEDCAVDFVFR